jgi:tetratricopeptide (TPR) repeat protein
MACGDYAKAQPLAERALDFAKKAGASDSEMCLCLIDLGYLYKNQGKLADAERLCEQGLELQEQVYNKDHPYVAYTLRVLGSTYQGQAKYRTAQLVLDRALAIMKRNYMKDDPIIAPFQVDIAKLLVA